jgi:hypothetical protein
MIFMSQSGLRDADREAAWDEWYREHLRVMYTVDGVRSTQRFKCTDAGHPPSLAVYTVASADVFHDPYYLSVRGMGEWLPLIDRRWYRRNLFEGAERAPEVPDAAFLLVYDRSAPEGPPGRFTWLRSVGLDASTPYRGIAVVGSDAMAGLPPGCAVYRPVTVRVDKDG